MLKDYDDPDFITNKMKFKFFEQKKTFREVYNFSWVYLSSKST
jgi:hypothetical protein